MPTVVARMPVTISAVCTVWARTSATKPAAANTVPSSAKRCAGCGGAGRPDNAATMGSLAAARAGHHDAASAVRTASAAPTNTAHHGSANGS